MRAWPSSVVLLALIYFAPLAALPIGFLIGRIRQPAARAAMAVIGVTLPFTTILGPDLIAHGQLGFGPAFALVLFAFPVALWILFAGLGVWVGSASRSGSN